MEMEAETGGRWPPAQGLWANRLSLSMARILKWAAISFSRGIFPTQGSNPRP